MAALDTIQNALALKRLPVPVLSVDQMPSANPLGSVPLPMPAGLPTVSAMPNPAPFAGAPLPAGPKVIDPSSPQGQLGGLQRERTRLLSTGDGISQIKNPFLRGLSRIGDVAESILAPGAAAVTPGTMLNHQRLLGQNEQQIGASMGNEQEAAKTGQTNATAAYFAARPDIEQSKIDQRQTAVQERVGQAAAARGQKVAWDPNGIPSFSDDYESQAFRDHQALSTLHDANTNKAKVQTEIAQNHYVPGTPEFVEAQRKLKQADEKIQVALGNLGIRHAEYNMHALGMDASGKNELPGVLHDETGTPIGSVQAGNVKPTTTARDAAARADSMVDIGNRVRAGLDDPEIQSYLGPLRGRVSQAQGEAGMLPEKVAKFRNDLVSYGAFQAGLHPVRGIGALEYFDKVTGGMGQTAEQLRGKLNSNDETAADVQRVGTMPTTAGINRAKTAPNAPSRTPKGGVIEVIAPDGSKHPFATQAQADQFKKLARIK